MCHNIFRIILDDDDEKHETKAKEDDDRRRVTQVRRPRRGWSESGWERARTLPPLVCALSYHGTDVIFAAMISVRTAGHGSRVLQTLELGLDDVDVAVAMTSYPTTGVVGIAMERG